jgi:hypothetical protein
MLRCARMVPDCDPVEQPKILYRIHCSQAVALGIDAATKLGEIRLHLFVRSPHNPKLSWQDLAMVSMPSCRFDLCLDAPATGAVFDLYSGRALLSERSNGLNRRYRRQRRP